MQRAAVTAALGAGLALLGACAREEPAEAPRASAPAAAQPAPEERSWIGDVALGRALAADGTLPAEARTDVFAPGQPVHLALQVVGDAPPGAAVRVVWFGPEETPLGEEVKEVPPGRRHLAFSAQDTQRWAEGEYSAEVWVGDERVEQRHFRIGAGALGANR